MTTTYNMDCLEYMKTLKDNEFDLIIADPPYGDCDSSWTSTGASGRLHNHGIFAKYCTESCTEEKQRSKRFEGGTWSRNYNRPLENSKTEENGIFWDTAPSQEVFEQMFRVSKNQIIWGATILIFHQQDVLQYGIKRISLKHFQWLCVNTHGLALRVRTLKCMQKFHKEQKQTHAFTLRKNQLACIGSCYTILPKRAIEY